MREDWNSYHAAMSKSPAPTTAPASSVGVGYDSPEYLNKLAAQIQGQFKVVSTVATLSEKFLSQQELNELPGVGKSFAVFGQRDFRPFSIYATSMAEPFIKGTPEAGSQTIKLLEPSRPLSDIT